LYSTIFAIFSFYKKLSVKHLGFFLLFGLIPTLIIFVFRAKWAVPTASHFFVFTTAMMAIIAALSLAPWLKNFFESKSYGRHIALLLLCLVIVIVPSWSRHQKCVSAAAETQNFAGKFYAEYDSFFSDFFELHPTIKHVNVQNILVRMPPLQSLCLPVASCPSVFRYPRPLNFFSLLLLPADIRQRINWSDTTDPILVDFARQNKERYPFLSSFFSSDNAPAPQKGTNSLLGS
jgi:hypothetical protein